MPANVKKVDYFATQAQQTNSPEDYIPARKAATIVCCSNAEEENYKWFVDALPVNQINWYFTCEKKFGIFDRLIQRPNLSKVYSGFQTARLVKQKKAELVISHEAELAFWSALFCQFFGVKVDHIALAFNYPFRPITIRCYLMTQVFKNIGLFVVSSTVEKELYQQYFHIPPDLIQVKLWKMGVIHYAPETPLEPGDYICAMGQFGRDYATLLAAMERLPDIRLVIVARPSNIETLHVPDNVKVITDVPLPEAMNILKFSRFMVLPLANSRMPTGHITLVSSMHLGKAAILTNSSGICDYFQAGHTALTYEAGNIESLAAVIHQLWNQPETCEVLGQNAQAFSTQHCSEERGIQELVDMLVARNILPSD